MSKTTLALLIGAGALALSLGAFVGGLLLRPPAVAPSATTTVTIRVDATPIMLAQAVCRAGLLDPSGGLTLDVTRAGDARNLDCVVAQLDIPAADGRALDEAVAAARAEGGNAEPVAWGRFVAHVSAASSQVWVWVTQTNA